jgi:type II secretory pathway pseudopilin PulG
MSAEPPEELTYGGSFCYKRGEKMQTRNLFFNTMGITLVEILIVIAIVGILALIGIPEIGRFAADYRARSAATDLVQNMRVARAMAIKENRSYLIVFDTANQRYLIGFDGDGDGDLITINRDTFGFCKDIILTFDTNGDGINDRGDGIPDTDSDINPADGVPDCVKVVNLSNYGNNIIFGYGAGTTPPQGPNGTAIPEPGVNFAGAPPRALFNPDGSMNILGSVYFQHIGRGYSYCVRISDTSGSINMWKWNGDRDNPTETTWTELR